MITGGQEGDLDLCTKITAYLTEELRKIPRPATLDVGKIEPVSGVQD